MFYVGGAEMRTWISYILHVGEEGDGVRLFNFEVKKTSRRKGLRQGYFGGW